MSYMTTWNLFSEMPVLGDKEASEATLCLLITEVEITEDSLCVIWAAAAWDTLDLQLYAASNSVILLVRVSTVSFREQISSYCLI